MPSKHPASGALPARFRRERLLIVGCGDVGLRVARLTSARLQLRALSASAERRALLRGAGLQVLAGDLDRPASLRRLAGVGTRVLHLAPPPAQGEGDPRTRALLRALRRGAPPRSMVYGSTTGVYGDCGGARVSEVRALRPATARARRRVAAEAGVRQWAAAGVRASVLRIPGIYAPDREGGTPLARLLRATPVLACADDVYTSHIHADDLARACVAALWRARARRVYNVSDDTELKMGDYFDLAADLYGVARPPRLPRALAAQQLPPLSMSFMSESRRVDNRRLKAELRVRLRYPSVAQGLCEPAQVSALR